MRIVPLGEMENRRGPEEWFTGSVWLDQASGEGGGVFRVLFEPGARTYWHTHPEGQYLYIVTGEGRMGDGEGSVRTVGAGDVVYFAPGEKHWHGAGPDTYMVHLAITPAIGTEGGTDWMEPVTDEQYSDT